MKEERTCQNQLALLWFAAGGLVLLTMIVQDTRQVYGDQSERAWSWFGTTVVPMLSLMIGAIAYRGKVTRARGVEVDPRAFYVSLGLSSAYLLLTLATVLLSGTVGLSPIESILASSRWLPTVQGLVGISIGGFFNARN